MNAEVETLDAFMTRMSDMQKKIVDSHVALENLKEEYRANLKARLGITDGENANVLDLFRAFYNAMKG